MFAPLGMAVTAVEDLPELISKGRRRVELQLANARVVGKFVVTKTERRVVDGIGTLLNTGASGPSEPAQGPSPGSAAAPAPPVPDTAAGAVVGRRTGGLRHAERIPGGASTREPGP